MNKTIPWWTPQIGQEEHRLLHDVLASNYVNEGDVTETFERALAELLDVKHVVTATSGTAAIMLALAGLGVGAGDEVIVPDVTFIATANAVVLAGATPVLVDVDPNTLNIDPDRVASAITARTKAIVPVHVSGRAAPMGSLAQLANEYGLFIVEDAAEGLASRHDGRFLGTLGDAGCLSFSPNKTITTGQGGAVLTNDDALHVRLRELKDQGRAVRGTGGDDVHNGVGYNFKFTNLQAALGLGQLSYLRARLARMEAIHRIYVEELSGLAGIVLPPFRLDDGERPQWTDALVDDRDELDRHLLSLDVHCRRFWFPLHSQSAYRQPDDLFPNSTRVCRSALWLPSAFTLADEDVRTVCGHIARFVTSRTVRGVTV